MMPGKKISCLLVFIVFMMISFAASYIGSYITHFVHPLILVGAIFLAVGLLFLNSYRRRIKRARASRFWPTVEGQIVVSDIAVLDDTDDSDDYYRPNIVYRYIVQDRGYEGKSVAFGMENTKHRNRERAEKVQLHYPVGGNVMVHYDPADPSVSTLEPGNTEWTGSAAPFMFALLFAFVVIGIGIYEQLNLSVQNGPGLLSLYLILYSGWSWQGSASVCIEETDNFPRFIQPVAAQTRTSRKFNQTGKKVRKKNRIGYSGVCPDVHDHGFCGHIDG